MECRVFGMEETADYKYVVVFSRYEGGLLLSQHRDRSTWETQGGHIEPGETPEEAARRELWEESGAVEYTMVPVCGYWAGEGEDGANGAMFFAEVQTLGPLPPSEMARTRRFGGLPEEVTYPGITPCLYDRVKDRFESGL